MGNPLHANPFPKLPHTPLPSPNIIAHHPDWNNSLLKKCVLGVVNITNTIEFFKTVSLRASMVLKEAMCQL